MVPALRLAIAFACGIFCSSLVSASYAFTLAAALLACAGLLVVLPTHLYQRGRLRGFAAMLALGGFGLFYASTSSETPIAPFAPPEHFIAHVTGDAAMSERWVNVDADIQQIYVGDRWLDTSGRAKLLIERSALEAPVGHGSLIVAKSRLAPPPPPLNPHIFDYGSFLRARGIGYQAFLKAGDYQLLRPPAEEHVLAAVRHWVSQRLESALPTPAELAVTKALVLGDRADLDDQTREVYTRTGAIHVLAVSGLHTGIIASILIWLLSAVMGRRWKALQLLLFLCGLLAYVALTGFSPSVQRSAVMFGVLFTSRILRLDTNAFNSLGLSALLLLAINPQLLFSLGFQLSYAAVAGILAFYPTLRRYLASSNGIINFFSQLTAVSIAATIATAPLTAYYFHQFPVYFMLSGILAVPLVSVALPLAIAAVAIDAVTALFDASAYWAYIPAYLFVWLCNAALQVVADLPGTLVEALWPSRLTVGLWYAVSLLLGIALLRRSGRMLSYAAVALLAVGCSITYTNWQRVQHQERIAYAGRSEVEIDVFAGGQVVRLSPKPQASAKTAEARTLHRAALAAQPRAELKSVQQLWDATRTVQVYVLPHARVLVLPEGKIPLAPVGPEVDVVFVREMRYTEPAQLDAAFPDALIVATDYIPAWRKEEWTILADRLHILPEDGALYLSAPPD